MEELTRAVRQPPSTPEGAALVAWFGALERTGHGWEALFEALLPHCDRVARDFADVVSGDEARSECMELTYERYVGDWLDGVARRRVDVAFATFVGDRLRDHFRAGRRKRARRAALDRAMAGAAAPHANGNVVDLEAWAPDAGGLALGAALSGEVPPPDGATRLREMVERVESLTEVDAPARAVLWLLARGHAQNEIARLTGLSEPTVSRAVARLRALLQGLARD